jgi:uncharacterized protein (DUF1800 family)
MGFRRQSAEMLAGSIRALMAGVLCADDPPTNGGRCFCVEDSARFGSADSEAGRVLHVLNRFTFGARPETLEAMMTDFWLNLRKRKEKSLEAVLLGQAVSPQTRATVLQQVDSEETQQQAKKSFTIRPNEAEPMAQVLNAAGPRQPVRSPLDRETAAMAGLLLGSPEFQRR